MDKNLTTYEYICIALRVQCNFFLYSRIEMDKELKVELLKAAAKLALLIAIGLSWSWTACLCLVVLYNLVYFLVIRYVFGLTYTRSFESMYSYSKKGCYIGGILIHKRIKNLDDVIERLRDRFVERPCNSILKRRIVSFLGDIYWTAVAPINYKDHVKIVADRHFSWEGLVKFLNEYLYEEMSNVRPKWEITVLQNYEDDMSVIIVKVSHEYGDGIVNCNAVFSAFDDYQGLPKRAAMPSIWYYLKLWVFLPIHLLIYGIKYSLLPSDANGIRTAPITNKGSLAFTRPLDVREMKDISKRHRGTINELMVTVCMRGIDDYLKSKHLRTESSVNIAIPVKLTPMQTEGTVLRQDISMLVVKFLYVRDGTSTPQSCAEQFAKNSSVFSSIRGSILSAATRIVFEHIYYVLGTALVSRSLLQINTKVTSVISNMAGPETPLHLCGNELVEGLAIVPVFATLICNFVMVSYCGKMRIACIADVAAVPDPENLVHYLENAYKALAGCK